MIVAYLDSLGLAPERLSFAVDDPRGEGTLEGTNLLARIRPGASPRLLLGAHYDSRPWADAEPDSTLHDQAVLGANDGGSGVGVLLVLARILTESTPPIGVDLVFFDAEDLGSHAAPTTFALGSQWLASHYPGPLPDAVLVLDMVGSPTARFGRELYAWHVVPEWVDLVPQIALQLGFTEWSDAAPHAVFDDHLPFLHQGVPANVILGLDDPYWHTVRDTPDKISARTLAHVGEVVLEIVHGGYVIG
jgi:Zn-dependent M28 family amino/carboxypeptidase